jgi:hypothetical protein
MAGEQVIELQTRLQAVARRIVETARLATSAHLSQSFAQHSRINSRRDGTGGAGPVPSHPQSVSVAIRDGAD